MARQMTDAETSAWDTETFSRHADRYCRERNATYDDVVHWALDDIYDPGHPAWIGSCSWAEFAEAVDAGRDASTHITVAASPRPGAGRPSA